MTDTYITFSGLYFETGSTVSVFMGGLDCGDYTVDSTGSINVPFGADSGGLTTPTYLSSLSPYSGESAMTVSFDDGSGTASYTIPVVIGPSYTLQGKAAPPAIEAEIKSPTGSGIGKTRRLKGAAAYLVDTVNVSFGGDFSKMYPAFQGVTETFAQNTMYTGTYYMQIADDYTTDGGVCWQVTRPGPFTMNAITSYLETEER